ncbi:uncharacterized protein [Miscanthus floridulus]|uniref:uncharacterized protein isoform X2 n=1 Tax=Miscanthus floridulus TaxID=154761 RepID=UPI0034591BDE
MIFSVSSDSSARLLRTTRRRHRSSTGSGGGGVCGSSSKPAVRARGPLSTGGGARASPPPYSGAWAPPPFRRHCLPCRTSIREGRCRFSSVATHSGCRTAACSSGIVGATGDLVDPQLRPEQVPSRVIRATQQPVMELMAMITQVLNEKGWSVETLLVHVCMLPYMTVFSISWSGVLTPTLE